jgi:hypothetical protein
LAGAILMPEPVSRTGGKARLTPQRPSVPAAVRRPFLVPAIGAGVLVTPLERDATFELFGSVIAALALVVAFEAWRTRPQAVAARLAIELA